MIRVLSTLLGGFVLLVLAGCASDPDLVTATPSDVTVAISADSAEEIDEALASAAHEAGDACLKFEKIPKFLRTVEAADGLVAHFSCINPPPEEADTETNSD